MNAHICSNILIYGWFSRLFLSVLHFNENSNKAQARKADGTLRYSITFPKAKQGEYSVKPIKEPSTYGNLIKFKRKIDYWYFFGNLDYVRNLLVMVLERGELSMNEAMELYNSEIDPVPVPRPLSAQYYHPEKTEAIGSYKQNKRFKLEEN